MKRKVGIRPAPIGPATVASKRGNGGKLGTGAARIGKGGRARALQALRHLLALEGHALDDLYDAYLRVAMNAFGLRVGVIGAIEGDIFSFLRVLSDTPVPFVEGSSHPVQSLFDSETLRGGGSLLCHHVAKHKALRAHPAYREGSFETYAAAPIRAGEEIFGVISLLDPKRRPKPYGADARAFLELLADTLGRAIDRHRLEVRRRTAEAERSEANTLFSTAFASAPIGMALISLDGRFLQVNSAICRFLGYSEDQLLALDFQRITYSADLDTDLQFLKSVLAGTSRDYQVEKRYVRPDGEIVWAQLNVALVRNEDGTPRCFISQVQDINPLRTALQDLDLRQRELEEANQKLVQLASIDPLTGILNRRALRERLDAEMRGAVKDGTPLAFVMIDVDHFKAYNDRHGHIEGDLALKAVAQRLKSAAREADTIGRFGGEEFLLLLPQADETAACRVAERLRKSIAAPEGLHWPLTVSAGVHVFRPDGKAVPAERPIAKADEALYRAKQNGRNRVEII